MAETDPIGVIEPTQDERTMAVLAQVLQTVGSWIAPLIILVIKRESRFVSFHALQVLLLQIAYMMAMAVFMVIGFGTFFLTIAHQTASHSPPPPTFFVLFPMIWLGFMGLWAGMLAIAVVYGIRAGRGEWAEYPLLGPLSRKILKIEPPIAVAS